MLFCSDINIFEVYLADICTRLLNELNSICQIFTIFLNEMSTLTAFSIIAYIDIINIVICINVVDVVFVSRVVVEDVRICIAFIGVITERIIVAKITFFVGINVIDVIRMFIVVFDFVIRCIMTNNQLKIIFSLSKGFVVV